MNTKTNLHNNNIKVVIYYGCAIGVSIPLHFSPDFAHKMWANLQLEPTPDDDPGDADDDNADDNHQNRMRSRILLE